jgi:alpha-L-rhamnosidase
MRLTHALLVMSFCLGCLVSPTRLAAQGAADLHCENAVNPRGVKNAHPQLSWAMPAEQRAYQILVATSEEKLKAGEADLWDSGRVMSDKRTAQYKGKPLTARQRCYWKVRVWGNYYQATGYSEVATWEMAVLTSD